MTRVYGAQVDVAARLRSHLFVLCPNNSGSTFLSKALGTSRAVWSLRREGQHTPGYAGPRTMTLREHALRWAASPDVRALFQDESAYDWETIRRAWYFQASAASIQADVFVQKSPPHLLIPHLLEAAFPETRFLIMVRHPYATIEGIMRRRPGDSDRDGQLRIATQHVLACLQQQVRNRDRYARSSLFFTYEEMCAEPERIVRGIQKLAPSLDDLTFDQVIPVKNTYEQRLTNFNAEQIARLSVDDRAVVREILDTDPAAMREFGYTHPD